MNQIVYSGSFDPITLGHIDIIQRAVKLGRLHILIAKHPQKEPFIKDDNKVDIITRIFKRLNIQADVVVYKGATVDYLASLGANSVLIRGVRDSSDWHYEARLDLMNKGIYAQSETVFLQSTPGFQHISSSYVRELLRLKKPINNACPPEVVEYLEGY